MKKSDLKNGMIVEYRNGLKRLYVDGLLYDEKFYVVNILEHFYNDLKSIYDRESDIVAVYDNPDGMIWSTYDNIELDSDTRTILRLMKKSGYEYLVFNETKNLVACNQKPEMINGTLNYSGIFMTMFSSWFGFLVREPNKIYSIAELLEKGVER